MPCLFLIYNKGEIPDVELSNYVHVSQFIPFKNTFSHIFHFSSKTWVSYKMVTVELVFISSKSDCLEKQVYNCLLEHLYRAWMPECFLSLAVRTFAAYACVNRKLSMQMFEMNTYVLIQISSPLNEKLLEMTHSDLIGNGKMVSKPK